MVDAMTEAVAFVGSPFLDVVATNHLARALYSPMLGSVPPPAQVPRRKRAPRWGMPRGSPTFDDHRGGVSADALVEDTVLCLVREATVRWHLFHDTVRGPEGAS